MGTVLRRLNQRARALTAGPRSFACGIGILGIPNDRLRPGRDAPIIWAMFPARQPARTATIILVCASLVCALSLGIRHTFGLFMRPMTLDLQWGREAFSFAIALQNLVWGRRSRSRAGSPTATAPAA